MLETWIEKRSWEGIKGKLPKRYVWGAQWAERESRKERASEGMLRGIRKEMVEKGKGVKIMREGMIVGRVKVEKQRLEDNRSLCETWARC